MSAIAAGRRLSVLVVSPKGVLGGAERWLLSVLDHSYRIDAKVILLADGPFREELLARGVAVDVVPVGTSWASMAKGSVVVGADLHRVKPDVILANGVKSTLVALSAARLLGTPVVWTKHDPTHEAGLGKLAGRGSARVIAVSSAEANAVAGEHVRVIAPPVAIPDGVARTSYRKRSTLLRLAMVTRFIENKGIDTAITALATSPNWELVVAGGPDDAAPGELERLTRLANDVGVSDRVHFVGESSNPWSLLDSADAAAVLSRPGGPGLPPREGFGMVTIEAAAAGVPVLADPRFVPSVDALYGRGVFEVDATNPASLAAALEQLADPRLRAKLGRAGASAARALPGPYAVANDVADVLADAARRPGAARTGGPPFTVATTVFNECAGIDKLVSDLRSQARVPEFAFGDEPDQLPDEIVIVDGGSTDGTWERLEWLAANEPTIRVIRHEGAGISQGRNLAIAAARNEWIACTDGGCVPEAGWLDSFRRAAATGDYDLLTGLYRVSSPADTAWQKAMSAAGYPSVHEARHPHLWSALYSKVFGLQFRAQEPTGRSVAFTSKVWENAGGYPEDLATAEDVVFGLNAIEAGAKAALVTDAVADWDQRPTLRSTAKMYAGYGRGDAQSGSKSLVGRDLVRASAYVAGPAMIAKGGNARTAALVGAAVYLSVPLARVIREKQGPAVAAMVPVVMAMRDISKAIGCLQGLSERRRRSK